MSKEMWIEAHEQVIDEYLEAHPEVSWEEAYKMDELADLASERAADNYADMIDHAYDMYKGK